ncbi:hypothetical protein BD626DRAFT_615850 [Schizophyllum amplum]|uniref:Uncharacterized protein n=1 Tax=Schizophyllum amplum TaxID=97359 RepID=A0A550CKM3_9AGAR|nr:hypothetical protein BD626DRAFT_615850 [Auriculariopsis ampla]
MPKSSPQSTLDDASDRLHAAKEQLKNILHASPSDASPLFVNLRSVLVHVNACADIVDTLQEQQESVPPIIYSDDPEFLKNELVDHRDRLVAQVVDALPGLDLSVDSGGFDESGPGLESLQWDEPELPYEGESAEVAFVAAELAVEDPSDNSIPPVANFTQECETVEEFDRFRPHILEEISSEDPSFAFGEEGCDTSTSVDEAELLLRLPSNVALSDASLGDEDDDSQLSSAIDTPARDMPMLSVLCALAARTPQTAQLSDRYQGGHSRRLRKVEAAIPKKFRLDKIVYCEELGDYVEQVAYTAFLRPGSDPTDESLLTRKIVKKAFAAQLETGGGSPLSEVDRATILSVQKCMVYILSCAREADIEHHCRRVHGEILTLALIRALVLGYYMRNGSSSLAKDFEGDTIPGVRATPDLEDIYGPGANAQFATEIKAILKETFIYQLLGIFGEHVDDLVEQLRQCPGYAHGFRWPSETAYMDTNIQKVVQVYTSMFYKKYLLMELSNNNHSIFFYRSSLDSTTLYISRVYTTPNHKPDGTDASAGKVPDCMTNLTRFAMRYIVGHPELFDALAKLIPEPQTKHFEVATAVPGPAVGVDHSTLWRHGRSFYMEAEVEQDGPANVRRSERILQGRARQAAAVPQN